MTVEQFGRYQIKSIIGRGGMSTVYLAHDPRFGRDVALKVLPHELVNNEQAYKRFQREARTIAQLEHPAIVPVYDFGEDHGQPYLAMRYMSGGSLAAWIKQRPLPIPTAVQIMQRITLALQEAHQKGIVHRDLKPSNILLDQRGDVYLSDFGIIKLTQLATTLTADKILGTPAYMSPEQVKGDREIDNRSDIYALGVLLYEMLVGHPPYQGASPAQVMMAHILQPVPDITAARHDLPAGLQTVITRAMSKEPEERFTDASELAQALTAAVPHLFNNSQTVVNSFPPTIATETASAMNASPLLKRPWWHWAVLFVPIVTIVAVVVAFSENLTASTTPPDLSTTETVAAVALLTPEPTPTHTLTNTLEATVVQAIDPPATTTAVPTSTPDPTTTPTPTRIFAHIAMRAASQLTTPETNLGLAPEPITLLGIPFEPGWKVSTRCANNPSNYTTQMQIVTSIPWPQVVYLLIQGGQMQTVHHGKSVGNLRLLFADGSVIEKPLVVGFNIRDWHVDDEQFVDEVTAVGEISEAWRGTFEGGDGRIDLLVLPVPAVYQESTLITIELNDTSLNTAASDDPCIHLLAITVEQ